MRKIPNNLATLALDPQAVEPLQQQLFNALRQLILQAQLTPGTRLPASRELAAQLGVSRNTVVASFEQLIAEGYLQAQTGSGTRVAGQLPESLLLAAPSSRSKPQRHATSELSRYGQQLSSSLPPASNPQRHAFQPGLPAVDEFPFKLWGRLVGSLQRQPSSSLLTYQHPNGLPELRDSIARYLQAARGVSCTAEQIIITSGAQAALDLSCRLLLNPGDCAWLEEPGYLGARAAMLAAGAAISAIPLDEQGINIDHPSAQAQQPRLIYVTPSYQYPLGVTMSLPRRLALLERAAQQNTWIIEDDYDSEYRYHGRPLSALQGLDQQQRVIYIGTFSKTMFPALRVAYLVVPTDLVEAFSHAIYRTSQAPSLLMQAAVHQFMDAGHFAAHVRRMRKLYASRQALFVHACQTQLQPHLQVHSSDAGMQLPVRLNHSIDIDQLRQQAEAHGIGLTPLRNYYLQTPPLHGFLMGYAGVPEPLMQQAISQLRQLLLAQKR